MASWLTILHHFIGSVDLRLCTSLHRTSFCACKFDPVPLFLGDAICQQGQHGTLVDVRILISGDNQGLSVGCIFMHLVGKKRLMAVERSLVNELPTKKCRKTFVCGLFTHGAPRAASSSRAPLLCTRI